MPLEWTVYLIFLVIYTVTIMEEDKEKKKKQMVQPQSQLQSKKIAQQHYFIQKGMENKRHNEQSFYNKTGCFEKKTPDS